MKNTILKSLMMTGLLAGISPLAAASLSLTDGKITPAPLSPIEENGEGLVEFNLTETSGSAAPAKDLFGDYNVQISIELNKLSLKDGNTSGISGGLISYFDVAYNTTDHRVTLTQNAEFPASGNKKITIPVSVIANSLQTDSSLNGFNANFSANDAGTTAVGNASDFTYTQANYAPVAVDDNVTAVEDTALILTLADIVTANDTDADATDVLVITSVANPSNGTVVLNSDGTVTFTPTENFSGVATFEYTINDGLNSDTATVTVNVRAVNDAPIGRIDSVTTSEETMVIINVLSNDSDLENLLTITNLVQPSNGRVGIVNEKVTYIPNTNFTGTDTFTYTPNDGTIDGSPVTVAVKVRPVNDTPIGTVDNITVIEDTAIIIDVLGNDSDVEDESLTITNLSIPLHGTATIIDEKVTYTPNKNFTGVDSFIYTPNDGIEDGNLVGVSITIDAKNDVPIAIDDSVSTDEDSSISIPVLDNDSDVDSEDTLAIKEGSITIPTHGRTTIEGNNIKYTPEDNFFGTDSFTYIVNDGTVDSNTATVTVTIESVNDVPIAQTDNVTVLENQEILIDLLENDSDEENDPLVISNLSTPTNGAVEIVDGKVKYVPNENFHGSDSFTYTPNDGTEDGKAVTVNIVVEEDTDGDGIIDSIDLDDDNDGILDSVEEAGDTSLDTDGDGIIDSKDLDSDNDGILDVVESGQDVIQLDKDNNGRLDSIVDNDNDGIMDVADEDDNNPTSGGLITPLDTDGDNTPNFQDLDSDNDGVSDLIEVDIAPSIDKNNDGSVDGEVDSNGIPTTVVLGDEILDTDGDTVPNYRDLDSDNDGLLDVIEAGGIDDNHDGLIDEEESLVSSLPDSNNNEIKDINEPNNATLASVLDSDGDGVIDDINDSDEDGIPDVVDGMEDGFGSSASIDTDKDGIADIYDIDDDNDGILDSVEEAGDVLRDTDGDGVLDSKDLDLDNDGIMDLIEAGGQDTDNNGLVDNPLDENNDGHADSAVNLPITDTDGDSIPDFQDLDSDNDGISDLVEAGVSLSNDQDNDGMVDNPEVNAQGISTIIITIDNPLDTDGDSVPDYRDLDSDNDGILDVVEVGGTDDNKDGQIDIFDTLVSTLPDSDSNGIPDVQQANNDNLPGLLDQDNDGVIDDVSDSDGDGIPDVVDGLKDGFATGSLEDTDKDGIIDAYDLDDDNDGILDLIEENGNPDRDTDGDGIVDSKDLDSDNDGILDLIEAGGTDVDNNGLVDRTLDSDNDGLIDIVDVNPETADNPFDRIEALSVTTLLVPDSDADGKPDFQDVDSDNDGISDLIEAGIDSTADTDNNGMVDGDVNDNGIPVSTTPIQVPVDTDRDKTPDYRDLDSDNDALSDVSESGEGIDDDDDGMIDDVDTLIDPNTLADDNEDGRPDYQEYDALLFPDTLIDVNLNAIGTVDVLENDKVNAINLATLKITGTENSGDSLIVEGEGTWSIQEDGSISFTPEADFESDPTPISYSIEDDYGVRRPAVSVSIFYQAKVRPDIKRTNLAEPVTVPVLDNDNGDLNVSTVEIVLPEGFRDLHPDAILSQIITVDIAFKGSFKSGNNLESGKQLIVPGEGTWWVNSDGTITYRAEEGIEIVDPTPISYKVFDKRGNELITDALITLKQDVVAGVSNAADDCQTSDNVSALSNIGMLFTLIFGSLFGGIFLMREKKNKVAIKTKNKE